MTLNDGKQTDIRRWISSLDQSYRMFAHHRDPGAVPEEPSTKIREDVTDEELAELESSIDEV